MLIARLIYILCCIEAVWLNIVYVDYLPIIILLVVLLTPLFSGVIMLFFKGKISVRLKASGEIAYVGDNMQIELEVTNKSIFPIINSRYKIRFVNTITLEETIRYIRIPLGAKKSEKIVIDINMPHCACVIGTLEWIRVYDYLNVFSRKIKKTDNVTVSVLPRVEKLLTKEDDIVNTLESNIYSTTKAGDDVTEIFGIREFANGDKMQRIHWKLTQKYNKILVKDYSLPINENDVLLFEMCEEYRNDLEKLDFLVSELIYVGQSILSTKNVDFKVGRLDRDTNSLEYIKVSNNEELDIAIKELLLKGKFNNENELLCNVVSENRNCNTSKMYYFVKENNDNVKKILKTYNLENNITIIEYQDENVKSA